MDIAPHQVIRLVQTGRIERALHSTTIWKCLSCYTCSSRCPREVDCAGVIDALRQQAAEGAVCTDSERRTFLFHQAFLSSIRRHGRLNELELIGWFKVRSFLADADVPLLFKDATLAPALRAKRKLHLGGADVRDRSVVQRIFERCDV